MLITVKLRGVWDASLAKSRGSSVSCEPTEANTRTKFIVFQYLLVLIINFLIQTVFL